MTTLTTVTHKLVYSVALFLSTQIPGPTTRPDFSNCRLKTACVEVEVTLRPTVSLSVLPLLEQVTRCYIYLSDNYFLYFSCRAPSLTRGRFCNLQCNDTSSISSYIEAGGLSASSSWCRVPNEVHKTKKKNSMVWVSERTMPTERPPYVVEVIANFCG
jgi:hypothetical protein